jgi:hypothetical protein
MKKFTLFVFLCLFALSACGPSADELAAQTATAMTATAAAWTDTPTPTLTFTLTPSLTATWTPSLTPTVTFTPTITETPTITATPTFDFPDVVVNKQAHCRYGPHQAFLHAADLYAGDTGTVRSRYINSNWLYIKFDKLNYFCWVAPSVVDVTGDLTTVIKLTEFRLVGPSVLYKPPQNVVAVRKSGKVVISWDKVDMTSDDDRGYLLDMFVCQDGRYMWFPVALEHDNDTSYTVNDEAGCPLPSSGKLYAVEKHGYTTSVPIPWPAP